MMLSKSSRIGQWRILKNVNNSAKSLNVCGLHASAVTFKRRGPTSDVKLPELIVDKQPDLQETLKQKLDRIDYYNNHPSLVNIGYTDDSEIQKNFIKTSNDLKNLTRANSSDVQEDDDNFAEFENTTRTVNFSEDDYLDLYRSHRLTLEYQNSTVKLANHYGIFRDLFHSDFQQYIDRHVLKANSMDFFDPKILKNRSDMLYFKPTVPLDVEFLMLDQEDGGKDSETMLCQSVYRGNIIPPEFGRISPQVNIDVSNINGSVPQQSSDPASSNSLGISLSGNNKSDEFYTLAMINLDSHFNDSGVCHWLVGNIQNDKGQTSAEEFIKYLPVYGIRGLGYHRYCFVLFRHKTKLQLDSIQDYDLGKRKFVAADFMKKYGNENAELKPVGLSWFQTSWNDSCKDVFYKFLDMRSPTYEYQHPKTIEDPKQKQFPGRAPFNIYLDNFRDPKDLAKDVLLERLKSIDINKSYDAEVMYKTWDGKPELPHIHPIPKGTPDWLKSTILKKRAKVGRYRGLRPASALLPYNNNADLDKPEWPRISPDVLPLHCPNPYPDGTRRPKPIRQTLWAVPLLDHHSLRIDFPEQLDEKDKDEYDKDHQQQQQS